MSPIPVGHCRLRITRLGQGASVGGMYASEAGHGEPIVAGAMVPSLFEHQKWDIQLEDSDKQTYRILFIPEGENSNQAHIGELGFANSSVEPGTPIIFDSAATYHIKFQYENSQGMSVCTIHPTGSIVESKYHVGVSSLRQLEIQEFPVGDKDLPAWVVYRQ